MGIDFLEVDHSRRNFIIFIAASLVLISLGGLYYMSNRGCAAYSEHLKSCTPYQCSQRVMGFPSNYMGQTALVLRREIIGLENDKYFNTSTCNVIETDDITKDKKFTCKYSDKTREIAVKRAEILFGIVPPPPAKTKIDIKTLRASYATRVDGQVTECK